MHPDFDLATLALHIFYRCVLDRPEPCSLPGKQMFIVNQVNEDVLLDETALALPSQCDNFQVMSLRSNSFNWDRTYLYCPRLRYGSPKRISGELDREIEYKMQTNKKRIACD